MTALNKIMTDLLKEVEYAQQKFPPYNSSHEGYAIIAEEVDELWELVRARSHDYKLEYTEALKRKGYDRR